MTESKEECQVVLDKNHLKLIDNLIPFYGDDRSEVIRTIIIDWFKTEYGLDNIISMD